MAEGAHGCEEVEADSGIIPPDPLKGEVNTSV